MKKEQGITLISLVITIIVLLILAGVTISEITNQNGLKQKVQEKEQQYNEIIDSEQLEIEELANSVYKNLGDVPEDAVAKMDSKYYTTLQSAIDEVTADNTKKVIFLVKDVQENITITENKKIVFYLEEHTLQPEDTTKNTVNNLGTITMIGGTVLAENVSAIQNGRNLTINGATITASNSIGIQNVQAGKITIKNITISSTGNALNNEGTINITNANLTSTADQCIDNKANSTLTINGGTYRAVASEKRTILNRGTLTITGGDFTSDTDRPLWNEGTGVITGGKFTGNNTWSVIANSGGNLTITGGTSNIINKVSTRKFANVNNGVLIIDGVTQPQGTIY